MKIDKLFNTLSVKEYFFYIDNHAKYTDFNTLGLYRSIVENALITLEQKIEVREYAHLVFRKTFDFLQLKDPKTFFEVTTLGQKLTKGDEAQIWKEIIRNQESILKDKKINHRNFGVYSKHNCGYADCPYNGLMIKQGSVLAYGHMQFNNDKSSYQAKLKSDQRKSDRKKSYRIIEKGLDD